MYKRVLLPLDGSDLAEQALPHAVAQAERFQAELILLRVLEMLPRDRQWSGAVVKEGFELTDKLARNYLGQIATRIIHEHGTPVQVVTADGRPHVEIIHFAENNKVDLIVMSTRGQSGFSRWLMGSVAERVVRGVRIPVLLIHAKENEP